MESEPEVVKIVLGELTHAPYVVTLPRQYDLGKDPKWYVTCLDGFYYGKTAHADTIWADQTGRIWIESVHLGSPTSWAEEEYGEKGAVQVMDIDYRHLSLPQVQARLKGFPKLYERIEAYRRAAGEVSRKSGIPIEMVFDARADMGWFLFRAGVGPKGQNELEGEIRRAVTAMKDLYNLTQGARLRDIVP